MRRTRLGALTTERTLCVAIFYSVESLCPPDTPVDHYNKADMHRFVVLCCIRLVANPGDGSDCLSLVIINREIPVALDGHPG